jgi:hypothetical protein
MVPTLVAMLALVLTGTPVAQAGGGKGPLGPDAFMLMAVFRCALLDPTRGQIALCGMWPSCPARINRREPAGGPSGR